MSRVGERGIVSGKFWLADPNEDMAWRNKDWIVEVVDETNEYQKGRHTFEVVFFKIIEAVDGEEAFTQSEEDIQRVNIIYVTQWDVTHKKNHEKHLRNLATLAKAKEIVAQGDNSDEEEEDDADNVPQQGPAMPKKRRLEKIKKVTSATFFVPVGDQVRSSGAMYKQKFSCLLDDNEPIWEYCKAGKKISSSTKRSKYLAKHHKAVYAKYIEPHASSKRINDEGEVVKLYSLEEAFQKHMKHALVICTDKRALSYGSTEAFRDFIMELDERYQPADVKTLARMIFALRNVLKAKLKFLVKKMQNSRGKKWASGSIDFWSSKGGCESFGGIILHFVRSLTKREQQQKKRQRATVDADADMNKEIERLCREASEGVEELDSKTLVKGKLLIAFKAFDKLSHTGINIKKWTERVLAEYDLGVKDFMVMVPDSAANGLLALKLMGMPIRVCWPHRFARCHHYALQKAAGTIGKLLRKVRRMSLRVHTSTKMTNRLLKAQQSENKVTTVTGSTTRAWNGDHKMVARVNALAEPLAAAFQGAQDESVVRPSSDDVGQVSDIVGNLADYSDDEGGVQELVERLTTEDNTMDHEVQTYQLPRSEADDANPELLAQAAPESFILSSDEKTLNRHLEAAFRGPSFVSTCVEGDESGTNAVTDGDRGYILMHQLLQGLWANTLEVPLETNTSTVARERFDGAVPAMLSQWPDGIKDYLTGYALEVLKRWGDGTRLIPDPWALMELAFNPLFKDLSKLPFIDRQLADEAEDLLLKEFDDAADFLNEKENAIDGPSPVPRHARRRSSNFGVQPPNQQQQVLGELAGFCDAFGNGAADEADEEALYNGKEALQQWRDTNFRRFVTFNESNVPTDLNLYEYFSFGNNAALQPVAYLVFLRLKSTILTEAAVERLFSFAKATLSDLRTSLSPELFEAMVFVAQNADQLEFTWEEVFDEYKKLLREAAAAAAAAT